MIINHAIAAGTKGFTVSVTKSIERNTLTGFTAATMVADETAAIEFASKFAKGLKVRSYTMGGTVGPNGWVKFEVWLTANKTTGDRNETSINRVRKFMTACDKLGLTLKFDDSHCLNQVKSREEFETMLAAL